MKKLISILFLTIIYNISYSQEYNPYEGYAWSYGYGSTVEEAKNDAVITLFSAYNVILTNNVEDLNTQTNKDTQKTFQSDISLSLDSVLRIEGIEYKIDMLSPTIYKVWCGINLNKIIELDKKRDYYDKLYVLDERDGYEKKDLGDKCDLIYEQFIIIFLIKGTNEKGETIIQESEYNTVHSDEELIGIKYPSAALIAKIFIPVLYLKYNGLK